MKLVAATIGIGPLCFIVSVFLPTLFTIRMLCSKKKDVERSWLTYWLVLSVLLSWEIVASPVIPFLGFYPYVKTAFCLWLWMRHGSTYLYEKWIKQAYAQSSDTLQKFSTPGKFSATPVIRSNISTDAADLTKSLNSEALGAARDENEMIDVVEVSSSSGESEELELSFTPTVPRISVAHHISRLTAQFTSLFYKKSLQQNSKSDSTANIGARTFCKSEISEDESRNVDEEPGRLTRLTEGTLSPVLFQRSQSMEISAAGSRRVQSGEAFPSEEYSGKSPEVENIMPSEKTMDELAPSPSPSPRIPIDASVGESNLESQAEEGKKDVTEGSSQSNSKPEPSSPITTNQETLPPIEPTPVRTTFMSVVGGYFGVA